MRSILRPPRPTGLRVTNPDEEEPKPDVEKQDAIQTEPSELCGVETAVATPELAQDQESEPINSPNRTLVSTPIPQAGTSTPSTPATGPSRPLSSKNCPHSVNKAELLTSKIISKTDDSADPNEAQTQGGSSKSDTTQIPALDRLAAAAAAISTANVPGITKRRDTKQRRARSAEPRRRRQETLVEWRPISW